MVGPSAAERYHARTNHSPDGVREQSRPLDWDHQPPPFKYYPDLPTLALPADLPPLDTPALQAIGTMASADGELVPDLAAVARLCLLSNGVTRYLRLPDSQRMAFRAAACTGALYHLELYLICGDLPGIPAGVYHYDAHDHALHQLRAGDVRAVLVEATGHEPAVARASLIVASTSTFWRNAWKYGARAYRHAYWDDGTLLANLLAVCTAQQLPARVVLGYADGALNAGLGVDGVREAVVSLVAVGQTGTPAPLASPLPPLQPLTPAPFPGEVRYPEIEAMHAASALTDGAAAARWRASAPVSDETAPSVPPSPDPRTDGIEAVIRRRGSTRQFAPEPVTLERLGALLRAALQPLPFDVPVPAVTPYLIVNDVDGLRPGTYVAQPAEGRVAFTLLRPGNFREHAGVLALQQALGAEAAVNVYLLANLPAMLARFGERGYRVAQLDAAIRAGRMYLAAYALRLGATGLTFYDDLVVRFFSPHAAGQSVMFLLAIGHRAPRRSG